MVKRKAKWTNSKPSTAKKVRGRAAEESPSPPTPPTPENIDPDAPPTPCPCGYYCGYFFLRCDNCHRGCHFQCLRMKRIEAFFLDVFVCQACKEDGIKEEEVQARCRKAKKPCAVVYEVFCNFHPAENYDTCKVKCLPIGHLPRDCPLKNDDCCLCGMECTFEHVLCEHCKRYFHCMCEGLAEEDVKAIDAYFCKECRGKRPSLQITYKDAENVAEDVGQNAVGGVDVPGPSGTQKEPPRAKRGRRNAPRQSGLQPGKGMRREVKEELPVEGVSSALFPPVIASNAGTHGSGITPGEKAASLTRSARSALEHAPSAKPDNAPLATAQPASGTSVKSEDDDVIVIDDDDDEHDDNVIYGDYAAAPKVSVTIAVRGQGAVSPPMNSTLIRNAHYAGSSKQPSRRNRSTPASEVETRVKAEEPLEQALPAIEQQPPPSPAPVSPAPAAQVKVENEAPASVPPSSAEAVENAAQEPVAANPMGDLFDRRLQEKEQEIDALREQLRQKDASLEVERAARAQEIAHLKQEIEKHKETIVKLTMERLGMRDSK